MHLNITSKEYSQEVMDKIEPFLYEWTKEKRGSISAEHGMKTSPNNVFIQVILLIFPSGLGFKKRNCIHYSKDDSAIKLMKQIKNVFDPKGILNPYKVLPDQ